MPESPQAVEVRATGGWLSVALQDGRTLLLPLEFFIRLRDATPAQIENVEYVDDGRALHWPELDEDVHVADLIYPPKVAVFYK